MQKKKAYRSGWITGLKSGPVETDDLVLRIRRFRGRLTIAEIVKQLDFKSFYGGYLTVVRLCREYEMVTADPEPDYSAKDIKRDYAMATAQDNLAREIAAAKAEAATAPGYKPGPLGWDMGDRAAARQIKSDKVALAQRQAR